MQGVQRIPLGGVGFDPLTETDVVDQVRHSLALGVGGWITAPGVRLLRRAADDPVLRARLGRADLVVATGAALSWASRLAGTPLPAPVRGAELVWALSAAIAREGRSVYLLGGAPEAPGRREGAHRAASVLSFACPGIRIAGHASPRPDFGADPAELAAICREVLESDPDVVYVGLDFSGQEYLISRVRDSLPGTWFVGWAAMIDTMVEGSAASRRYLHRTAPHALRLLAGAAAARVRRP